MLDRKASIKGDVGPDGRSDLKPRRHAASTGGLPARYARRNTQKGEHLPQSSAWATKTPSVLTAARAYRSEPDERTGAISRESDAFLLFVVTFSTDRRPVKPLFEVAFVAIQLGVVLVQHLTGHPVVEGARTPAAVATGAIALQSDKRQTRVAGAAADPLVIAFQRPARLRMVERFGFRLTLLPVTDFTPSRRPGGQVHVMLVTADAGPVVPVRAVFRF